MDWSQVTDLTIPERNVKQVSVNGVVLWEKGLLPSGYTQLEYIKSTGTQYIMIPSKEYVVNEELEIDFAYTVFNGNYPTVYGSNKSEIYTNLNGDVLTYGNISISEPRKFELNQKQTIKAKFTSTFSFVQALFAYARGVGNTEYYSRGRMYKFIDRLNGVEIFNMIPAMRNSDGKVGMYDTVTKQFFTNVGTGEFIAGDTV